jgi:hypothetical protein
LKICDNQRGTLLVKDIEVSWTSEKAQIFMPYIKYDNVKGLQQSKQNAAGLTCVIFFWSSQGPALLQKYKYI